MFGPSEFGGTCAEQHHSADGAHRRGTERGENRSRWNSNSDNSDEKQNKSFEFIRQVERKRYETITIWKLKPDTGLRVPYGLRTWFLQILGGGKCFNRTSRQIQRFVSVQFVSISHFVNHETLNSGDTLSQSHLMLHFAIHFYYVPTCPY